jgi:hypothetical protein
MRLLAVAPHVNLFKALDAFINGGYGVNGPLGPGFHRARPRDDDPGRPENLAGKGPVPASRTVAADRPELVLARLREIHHPQRRRSSRGSPRGF